MTFLHFEPMWKIWGTKKAKQNALLDFFYSANKLYP